MDNLQIAQEINTRIGNSPVPFDSVYSIALAIYQELGGEGNDFDSVYSILLEILPLASETAHVIDDSSISLTKTWSSSKIASELADAGFKVEIVTELPSVGDPHTIYFILKSDSSTGDIYDEWMYINNNWEMVGNTQIDLSDYAKISDVDASLALKADKSYVDASLALKADLSYVNSSLALKQNLLSAGQNIAIDTSNNISAQGYVFNDVSGNFAEKYRQDSEDGGQLMTNTVSGSYGAHAEGYATIASGDYGAHAEGQITSATGMSAHSEGLLTTASNGGSHAEGNQTLASGAASHAEGYGSRAQSTGAGQQQQSWGAHAEGWQTIAQADAAHSEGYKTLASGVGAHAEGGGVNALNIKTTASGTYSHAEGYATQAQNPGEHAEGFGNISHTSGGSVINSSVDTISAIGAASDLSQNALTRRNAREIMGNGDYYLLGVGNYDGVHIKGETGAPSGLKTLQEVINSKADAYEVATSADIEALFTPPAPTPTQPTNYEVWYTTESGEVLDLSEVIGQYYDETEGYCRDMSPSSNVYENGKGVLTFPNELKGFSANYSGTPFSYSDVTTIYLPSSIDGTPGSESGGVDIGGSFFEECTSLTDIYYGGTINQFKGLTSGMDAWLDVDTNVTIHCSDGDITLYQYLNQ